MDDNDRYWFPAKRYGWGWGLPTAWQGWVVMAIYVAVLVGLGAIFPPAHSTGMFVGSTVLATVVLVLICWITGEPPKWRWGGE